MNRQLLLALLGCAMLCHGAPQDAPAPKPLRLYVEVYANNLGDPRLSKAVDEYGIDGLDIHRAGVAGELPLRGFPRLSPKTDADALAQFRKQLEPYKKKRLKIILSGPEPVVPANFFEVYPEAANVSNGLLWKFIEERTAETFRQLPEVDSLRCHFWEAPLLNDSNYFRELFWAKPAEIYRTPAPYYSPADYLKEVIAALARGARAAGRRYAVTSFSHHPWQEKLLIEVLSSADPTVAFDVWHLPLAGDFDPYRPPNRAILAVTGRESTLLFDGFGEYLGWTLMPYSYPGQIQGQLRYALANNRNIDAVCTRVSFSSSGLVIFGTLNDVNLYALAQFARNPDVPIEKVWSEWAERRFGKVAAPKVISALKRTYDIGNLTYYFRGMWMHNHSVIGSDLRYMEAKVLHSGRSMIEWKPENIEDNALIREFMEHPGERTIEAAVADRREALRLNALSLEDVEAARPALPAAEYDNLKKQFTLQRHFVETSIPHVEAFLRYWIHKKSASPPPGNMVRLEQVLAALDAKASEIEKLYGEKVPVLTGKAIRRYTGELRQSVGSLSGRR